MQRIEVTVKANNGEPLALVFASTDAPETVAERLRLLTWLVGQVDGHAEPRRRAPRQERAATIVHQEPPAEA
jgi:hypothetical protein